MSENQSLSLQTLKNLLQVAKDNQKVAQENFDWASVVSPKIQNKFFDQKIREEAHKCLIDAKEVLLSTSQRVSHLEQQLIELSKTSGSAEQNQS